MPQNIKEKVIYMYENGVKGKLHMKYVINFGKALR